VRVSSICLCVLPFTMNAYIEHYDIMIWGNNVVDVAVSG